VNELENSVAIGLADGLFWNFLRNVGLTIENDYRGGEAPITIKVEESREKSYES
jgi:hypothetical protein